jgi:hypothetical protein
MNPDVAVLGARPASEPDRDLLASVWRNNRDHCCPAKVGGDVCKYHVIS